MSSVFIKLKSLISRTGWGKKVVILTLKVKLKLASCATYNEESCKVYVFYLLKENPT